MQMEWQSVDLIRTLSDVEKPFLFSDLVVLTG